MACEDQFYRDQLRSARALALADSEGFMAIIHALESMGQQFSQQIANLSVYQEALTKLARKSLLCAEIPQALPEWHTSFLSLYDELRRARNDAVHQGSYARTLTNHAVDLAIVLEDALMSEASIVSQFMVREVVIAEHWHPVSYVRQVMLRSAFSYLPSLDGAVWGLISESSIARFVRGADSMSRRKDRLLMPLSEASKHGLSRIPARTVSAQTKLSEALQLVGDHPLLVLDERDETRLIGLLTASDLL